MLGDGRMAFCAVGQKPRLSPAGSASHLAKYFTKIGPSIIFEQEAMLVPPGMLLKPNRDLPPFDSEKLRAIDWEQTDVTREVQGPERDPGTIQARAIRYLLEQEDWDVVIDDHGSGELADVVALRITDDELVVSLIHCKSTSGDPGTRVADLYEVCGQAQKSVRWKRNPMLMLRHLIRREQRRLERNGRQGFEKGDGNALYRLEREARAGTRRLLRHDRAAGRVQDAVERAASRAACGDGRVPPRVRIRDVRRCLRGATRHPNPGFASKKSALAGEGGRGSVRAAMRYAPLLLPDVIATAAPRRGPA